MVRVMDGWWGNVHVQRCSCAVLCNATYHSREGQTAALEAGALDAVLRAMSTHRTNAEVRPMVGWAMV